MLSRCRLHVRECGLGSLYGVQTAQNHVGCIDIIIANAYSTAYLSGFTQGNRGGEASTSTSSTTHSTADSRAAPTSQNSASASDEAESKIGAFDISVHSSCTSTLLCGPHSLKLTRSTVRSQSPCIAWGRRTDATAGCNCKQDQAFQMSC